MRTKRSLYGYGVVLIFLVTLGWIGGTWSAKHGTAYVFSHHRAFGGTYAVVAGVELMAFAGAVQRYEPTFPFFARTVAGDDYGIFVVLSVPDATSSAARIPSAELVLDGEARDLALLAADEPSGPPASSWRPLQAGDGPPGRRIDYFVLEEVPIPPSVRSVQVRLAFEVRLGDETRRGQATLELSPREWTDSRFQAGWTR